MSPCYHDKPHVKDIDMKLAMILWFGIIGVLSARHLYREFLFWLAIRRAEQARERAASDLFACGARLRASGAAMEACVNAFNSKH